MPSSARPASSSTPATSRSTTRPLSGDAVTDLSTIAEYGRRGVLALLADSTNAERPGFTATEQTVAEGVRALFNRARKKRIIVATFASNIYRIQQIIDLAIESGRKVAVSGRSMVSNTEMAKELGYLHVPDTVLIDIEEVNKYPPEKVVLITTGSQGEPLSALSRMAQASHRNVKVGPGDFIIISARPIPGNEKTVTKVVNGLLALGAEVIYENMYDTHVSGHACQEEQKLMLTLAHPQYFLPVHGEFKQLKRHAETAEHLGYIPGRTSILPRTARRSASPGTAWFWKALCLPAPSWWTATAWAMWATWCCGTATTCPRTASSWSPSPSTAAAAVCWRDPSWSAAALSMCGRARS